MMYNCMKEIIYRLGNKMSETFSRCALLIGDEAIAKLNSKKVAIFGVGGVGGYVCEALVRSGVGSFELIDRDVVSESNINRQIIATHSTIGKYKTAVMHDRMLDINPDCEVTVHDCFFLPENADDFHFEEYDYVVDAVDTVTAKIEIITRCKEAGVPVISAMGAGNKLDPTKFKVADIYKTNVCPLARVMRRELKKRGIRDLKVVYSEEEPLTPGMANGPQNGPVKDEETGKVLPGSMAFVPSVAGLVIASEVVKDLIKY